MISPVPSTCDPSNVPASFGIRKAFSRIRNERETPSIRASRIGESGAGTGTWRKSSVPDPSAVTFPRLTFQRASTLRIENPAPDVEKTESGRSDEETPDRRMVPLPGLQKAGEKRRSPEAAPFRNRSRAGAHRNNPVHSHEATISSRATGGFPGKERVTPERRIPEGKRNRASCADRSTP